MGKIKSQDEAFVSESSVEQETKKEILAWKNSRWMFIDTETTGFEPSQGARVFEIGYAIVRDMKLEPNSRKQVFIDPGMEIPEKIVQLTHVDLKEFNREKIEFKKFANKLSAEMSSVDFIVAYNAPFDRKFIDNEYNLIGDQMPKTSIDDWLDPLSWVREKMPALKSQGGYNLSNLTKTFDIQLKDAHRAGADAEAGALVTIKFLETVEGKLFPDDAHAVSALQKDWQGSFQKKMNAWKAKKDASNKIGESKYGRHLSKIKM